MSVSQPPGESGRTIDTASLGARLAQAAMAIVLTIVSVLLMLTTHRLQLALGGIDLPAGLVFGAVLQIVICVFLWSATGSRFPLLLVGGLWGMLATPFLGESIGGGVLLPAQVADIPQISGWIVQGLGILIPFLMAGLVTVLGRRAPRRR
ncbi:hypothetical protein CFK41_11365 [Brachybacterium ginsengisoli]|uniref:Uncharacterized protein n=1 Tax=Brachybacterium ginsengisoli TaxID=1331682 RepID=A0A291GYV9_9MICO|nr:hypothetical protein [Brachybacterium ginsengisoli]ATG55296.1 hypothetical protein CFK41_11365 [Brachybacterium ginsengisoli]